MALRFVGFALRQSNVQLVDKASVHTLKKIGKREIVGHGMNGTECYGDNLIYPMPAIRFKEPSKESLCLHAKECLNWSKLTLHEKKALYRHSYCQTFEELKGGTGHWKLYIAAGLLSITIAVWVCIINHKYLYGELPDSFDEEHQKAQLKRILDLEVNPITGIASQWDYENKKWK